MDGEWIQQWGTILIILAILLGCVFFYFNSPLMHITLREGLENKENTKNGKKITQVDNPTQYVEILKNDVNTMKHNLNIPTNRTEYENIIMYLEDLVHYHTLDMITNKKIDKDDPTPIVNELSKHTLTIQALNEIMAWMDKK